MSANQGNRSKKLYFDVYLGGDGDGGVLTNQTFLCTQFTAGTPGDRYGCLLQAAENCTGSTPANTKRSRAVSAWFQPSAISVANTTTPATMLGVQFVQPTSNGTNKAALTALPYLTVGGSSVATKAGNEAIYGTAGSLRHFSVRVRRGVGQAGGNVTVAGVLYVQRQHSIEV